MTSIADGAVWIRTAAESALATPSWFGEAVLLTAHLRKHGVFHQLQEQVRCARRRFGRYDVIDFLAVLFGYAVSGERTLEEYYERLRPFAIPFMALFGRDQLPSRSALSRFLAALTEAPWKPCARSFSMISWLAHSPPTSKPEGWEIEPETPGSSSTSTARGKRPANVAYHKRTTCLPPFGDWRRSVLQATPGASAARSSAPAQSSARPIAPTGSARLAIVGMGAIGTNCVRGLRPLAGI
jgi:hypothetical protein